MMLERSLSNYRSDAYRDSEAVSPPQTPGDIATNERSDVRSIVEEEGKDAHVKAPLV